MKLTKMGMVTLVFLVFASVSCNKEDDPVNEAQILAEYLEDEAGDYANTLMPAMKTAEEVNAGLTTGTVYLVDVRDSDDWAAGHVEGAVNVPLAEVLSHLEGTTDDDGKEIILISYSGQSAAWVTNILRVAGYENAYSMNFGMSSWNVEFATPWIGNTSSEWASSFVDGNVEKGSEGELPILNTGQTDGKDILMARIDELLSEGYEEAVISASEVFATLDIYYIVNYWNEADYTKYGHIPGAMQYTPGKSIALEAELKTLPSDKTIVVYTWTGQTSASLASYLRLLGYDARSLEYGANTMIHKELEKNKWTEDEIMGYEYVNADP